MTREGATVIASRFWQAGEPARRKGRAVGWRALCLVSASTVLAAALPLVTAAQPDGGERQTARERGGAPLRVCLLERDLPRAERATGTGFDLELMERIAERLDRPLERVWRPSGSPFSEIEDSELPLGPLAAGACDVVPSVPGRSSLGELEGELVLTRPYYGAAFELVLADRASRREPAPQGLDQLASEVVAVRLQTLAQFALQRRGLRWLAAPTTAEVLGLLESGEATAALVWGPDLARGGLTPAASWEPPVFLRWNLHLAVRAEDAALSGELDRALAALLDEGVVATLAGRWGLAREPFDGVFDPATWSRGLRADP